MAGGDTTAHGQSSRTPDERSQSRSYTVKIWLHLLAVYVTGTIHWQDITSHSFVMLWLLAISLAPPAPLLK